MKRALTLAAVLAFAVPAFAKEPPPIKAGIHQQCLQDRAEGESTAADAWVSLGQLDQVRGDLKAAYDKYRKAFDLGADVTKAQLDFTLVNGVLWIQNDACPVPVPALTGKALMSEQAEGIAEPKLRYPPILMNTQSEGTVLARTWLDEKGNVLRIAVTEASAGVPRVLRGTGLNVDSTNRPGVEAAERMVSRVQFALNTIEVLRTHDFGRKARGKVVDAKVVYLPPDGMSVNLPRGGPNTDAGAIYDPQATGK